MSTGDGGAASRTVTTTAITIKQKCAWCSAPFAQKGTNPDEKCCSKHCLKMARAENQPEKRQSLRRKNSLSSIQPVTSQPTVETAAKRNLSYPVSRITIRFGQKERKHRRNSNGGWRDVHGMSCILCAEKFMSKVLYPHLLSETSGKEEWRKFCHPEWKEIFLLYFFFKQSRDWTW